MEGFPKPENRPEGQSLGDILENVLGRARETARDFFNSKPAEGVEATTETSGLRVVDGVLDISSLSPEDLSSVEGIEPGVVLNGVVVLFPNDIRTTTNSIPYPLANPNNIGRLKINGKKLAIDKQQNPTLPTNAGLNNFEVTGVDEEYIYLSAIEDSSEVLPKPETLEVRNNTIDLSSYAGGFDQSYEAASLATGQALKDVFIRPDFVSPDSGRLPLRINGKSVRLYDTVTIPNEADYFDLNIVDIYGGDIFVQISEEKVIAPETPRVENGVVKIPGLELPRVYTGDEEERNFSSEGVEAGTVIKDVFLYECNESARQYFKINGNRVYIEKGGVDVDGVYDVRVLKISFSNEYIDLEVLPAAGAEQRIFAVKDGMVEIPELSKRIEFTEDEGRPDFEVDGLGEGVVLRNLFLDRDTYYQAFELNGQNVYLAGQTPSEAGNYDVVVDQIAPGSVDVRIVKRSEQSQKSEVPTVKDGEVSIPGLELPRPDSYTNSEYSIEGLKEGIVIKNVFLRQCGTSEVQYFLLNNKRVFIENTPVLFEGVYDVRVVKINSEEGNDYIDIEIVAESEVEALGVKDGVLEIPELSQRLDVTSEKRLDIEITNLEPGIILKNVFLQENAYRQFFKLNGRKVYIEGEQTPEDGNYDIEFIKIDSFDNYEFKVVNKSETSAQVEKLTVRNNELEIPELSQRLEFDEDGEVSINFDVDGLETGTVLKNVFLAKNVSRQPFSLNDGNVYIEPRSPSESGNYDIKLINNREFGYYDFEIVYKRDAVSQNVERTSANRESGKSIEIGSVVENVVFRKRSDGTYVSANPDGKAFLFESVGFGRPRAVAVGAPVNVRIIRDTKPGKSDGFYIVRYESAAETERQPESLQVRNGEVNLANVYGGQETDIIVGGLTEGIILSDLRVRPGDDNSRLPLSINGKPVYLEGGYVGRDSLYTAVISRETQFDYEITLTQPERTFRNDFRVLNGAVDFGRFDKSDFTSERPNFIIPGFGEEGTVLRNVYVPKDISRVGFVPFDVNGKRLDYEGDRQPNKAGFYNFVVVNSGNAYYDVLLTDESRENLDSTSRVTINESELAQEPQHEEFFKNQVSALRTPSLQTALMQARGGIPDMSYGREMLTRTKDMRGAEADGERHRHFTALGSAMYRERSAYRSFNAGIDVAVEHASNRTREWLKNWEGQEPPRLPLIVLGSGPHGATFLSTFRMYDTTHEPLVVDSRKHIGGQFADAEEPVFRLNSRNRPQMEGENREKRNLPGTEQTINPLGTMATLQVSDLSGEAYVTQDALAYATRFNTITAAEDFLTECRIVNVQSTERADGTQVERCTFIDERDQSVYRIDTDELVVAGGIGKDVFNFKNGDEATTDFLNTQAENLERGERPLAMSFPQMVQWFGNPNNRSPLKGVKEVVVSGGGDSASVAVGILLGYEPGANRMPVSLDRVEKVYWVGQDLPTKEEWLRNIRTRYAQIGLEFPREEIESYYSRIVPVPGAKVNNIYDVAGSPERNDRVEVFTSDNRQFNADLYIACNGFKNDLPNVLAGANAEAVIVENLISNTSDTEFNRLLKPGSRFVFGGQREIRVISVSDDEVEYIFLNADEQGQIQKATKFGFKYDVSYRATSGLKGARNESIPEVFVPKRGIQYEELFDEEGFAIGKKVAGSNITLVGPASELTLSSTEKQSAPVLEQIPENTAALFRYGRGTETAAQWIAKRLTDSARSYDRQPEEPTLTLTKSQQVVSVESGVRINLNRSPKEMPYHVGHMEALKLALSDHLAPIAFPANISDVELSIVLSNGEYGGRSPAVFEVKGLSAVNFSSADSETRIAKWLKEIADDTIVAGAIESEARIQSKSKRGREALTAAEINRKRIELEALTGRTVAESGPQPSSRSRLTLRIPVRGSTADVRQLTSAWEDRA